MLGHYGSTILALQNNLKGLAQYPTESKHTGNICETNIYCKMMSEESPTF